MLSSVTRMAEYKGLRRENEALKQQRAELERVSAESSAAVAGIEREIEHAMHELAEWRRETVLSHRIQACLLGMFAESGSCLTVQLVKVLLSSVLAAKGHTFLPVFVEDTRAFLEETVPAVSSGSKQPEQWLREHFEQQSDRGSPPAAALLLIVPILLGGIAVVGVDDNRLGGHARAVHYATELVASVLGHSQRDDAGEVALGGGSISSADETIATWCEMLWDVLSPVLHGSAPSATIFRQAMPPMALSTPDACERLLQVVGALAPETSNFPNIPSGEQNELDAKALFDDPWAANAWASAMACENAGSGERDGNGGERVQRSLVAAMLAVAGGVAAVPQSKINAVSKEDRELVEEFAKAVAPLPSSTAAARSGATGRTPTLKEMGRGRFGSLVGGSDRGLQSLMEA